MRYRYKEKIVEARRGLGESWFAGWVSKSGGTHRLVAKDLPLRESRAEAQADLDAWAKRKGLVAVCD